MYSTALGKAQPHLSTCCHHRMAPRLTSASFQRLNVSLRRLRAPDATLFLPSSAQHLPLPPWTTANLCLTGGSTGALVASRCRARGHSLHHHWPKRNQTDMITNATGWGRIGLWLSASSIA